MSSTDTKDTRARVIVSIRMQSIMSIKPVWCRGEDSNLHILADSCPSSMRVYQFRHHGTWFYLFKKNSEGSKCSKEWRRSNRENFSKDSILSQFHFPTSSILHHRPVRHNLIRLLVLLGRKRLSFKDRGEFFHGHRFVLQQDFRELVEFAFMLLQDAFCALVF